jgi:hypothetical protein
VCFILRLFKTADKPSAEPSPKLPEKSIRFYHPAYPTIHLLEFDCLDGGGTGFHFRTALTACSIVACNRAGFLTEAEDGRPIDQANDSLLRGEKYYYYAFGSSGGASVCERDGSYPICPSFNHWQFPHGKLPETWPDARCQPLVGARIQSKLADATSDRDHGCVVTAQRDWAERAHLVPMALPAWFLREQMADYVEFANRDHGADATANSVMLCHDMHKALDNFYWAAVPKGAGDGARAPVWVAQFVKTTEDLGFQHHGRALRISPGVAPQLLLARFALLVLGRLTKFLAFYKDKGVMAVVVVGDTRPLPKVVPLTADLVDAVFSQRNRANPNTPSGSQSRKRIRRETPQAEHTDSRSPPVPCASCANDDDDGDEDGFSAAKPDSRSFGGPPPLSAVVNASDATVAAMYGGALEPSNFGVEPFHLPLEGCDQSPDSGRPAKRRHRSSSCTSAEAWAKRAVVDIGEVTRKLGHLERAQELNELMGWI